MHHNNQCRAYCQCEFCKNAPHKTPCDTSCLKISKANCDGTGPSKDELYAKCLQKTLNNRALMASMKNANRFIPDEMLVSSKKRREAKEQELASLLVPVRRRDRLEEVLLLEHQARLREEKRRRAERRALGLPEEEEEEAPAGVNAEEAIEDAAAVPSSDGASVTSSQQRRLGGSVSPSSACSADRDLHATLRVIEEIVEDPHSKPDQPLTRLQLLQLRKVVHEQSKKSRKQVEECPNQPHYCPHCFAVNVQGKHLCPCMSGSVAFRTTGKVINPGAGVKFGTNDKPLANGQYDDHINSTATQHTRIHNFNPHPHGTGVVFLPVVRGEGVSSLPAKPRHEFHSNARTENLFNNNIPDNEAAARDIQFPGSTYNVYDDRDGAYGEHNAAQPLAHADPETKGDITVGGQKAGRQEVTKASAVDPMKDYKTTSALWRTTNQDRETDLQRFLDFQKERMNTTSKQVYDESASRFAPAAAQPAN